MACACCSEFAAIESGCAAAKGLQPSCRAPHGHDQTRENFSFSLFFDLRQAVGRVTATKDSSIGRVAGGRVRPPANAAGREKSGKFRQKSTWQR